MNSNIFKINEDYKKPQNSTKVDDLQLHTSGSASINSNSILGIPETDNEMFEKIEIPYDKYIAVKVNLSRATLKDAREFKDYLENLIREENKNVAVDLNSCEFIDSSFLGALVSILKRLTTMGKSFKIVFDQNNNLPIFSATRMDKIFTIYNSLEEACKE